MRANAITGGARPRKVVATMQTTPSGTGVANSCPAMARAAFRPKSGGPQSRENLDDILARNIQALLEVREQFDKERSIQDRVADAITAFTGSLPFVFAQAAFIFGWILLNSRMFTRPFDPFPFAILAMVASIEAIFLSTFVLISQNRMAKLADRRADLDLQINLLAEHEVTRLIGLVDAIAKRLGIPLEDKPQVEHLKQEVAPEEVLQKIELAEKELEKATNEDGA